MCGISVIAGKNCDQQSLEAMVGAQSHRGPDASGTYFAKYVGLGHNRLSIIDLSEFGRQPMADHSGRYQIVFNGEIYNYKELRSELSDYPFQSDTDTEVLLAAFSRWGEACLDRLHGMFAFAIYDIREATLFAAKDRFGVKPLYYCMDRETLYMASEIKAFAAAGIELRPCPIAWANYLARGIYDMSERTFWEGVHSVPPGHKLRWKAADLQTNDIEIACWYDIAQATLEIDSRPLAEVREEYEGLLADSLRKRFQSDVTVGINLSGGLDSSVLLGLVDKLFGAGNDVKVFSYVCGDERYDELPWVQQMLQGSKHPLLVSQLTADAVPGLAEDVWFHQDEPFGGLPTLAYSLCFEKARSQGVTVLLDGQGMDEQWAGYDYYRRAMTGDSAKVGTVQGTQSRATRPECLSSDFLKMSKSFELREPFGDALRDLQYRDTRYTKIPKALRFNDRVSMMHSTELREPFLDHRLFELALRQPVERKIQGGTGKWALRQIAADLVPRKISETPKRPLQTPQREWLRGEIKDWADTLIEDAIAAYGNSWLNGASVRQEWHTYLDGGDDNSFYVWQWISLGLMSRHVGDLARVGKTSATVRTPLNATSKAEG